jgi:hypothetical protein
MNPFELRFSVFNTAKTFLEEQYKANMAAWELLNKTSKKTEELAPSYPKMHEIIEKAIEINEFVSGAANKELINTAKRLSGVSGIF